MKRSKIFKVLFALVCLMAVERFCYSQTKGFRLPKATTSHPYPFTSPFQSPPESLFQNFYYLDKGVQFYVFIGEDQKTILKLFKHHHTGPSYALVNMFPTGLKKSLLRQRNERMMALLKSVKLAQDHLPNETALLYTHLSKTQGQLGKLTLYDPLKIKHTIDLDQTEFVLQKRVEPTSQRLHTLFSKGRKEEGFSAMICLLNLIEKRAATGIKNKDNRIVQNTGFFENKPVEVDLGSYTLYKSSHHANFCQRAREKGRLHFLRWIHKHYPAYEEEAALRLT